MNTPPPVICFPFIGDQIGGSHVSAIKLIQELDPAQYKALVVLHFDNGPVAELLSRNNISFVKAPDAPYFSLTHTKGGIERVSQGLFGYCTKALPILRSFLRSNGVGIVHTNDGTIHTNWGLPARAAGAALLWHHRGDPGAKGVNAIAPLLANHIVTVSNFSRPRRPILPISRRLSVVHSPFDRDVVVPDRAASRAALIREIGCAPETRLLGYFGTLVDRKRPVTFVDAVHAFIQRHPEIPVAGLIFGQPIIDGPRLDETVRARAKELGIADRIHLMGFRQPVEPLMGGVDVLLVPAVREPFGRTLIEAMLLGTPVVATADGGNIEAIEDGVTGFLVRADDPDAFTEPLFRLLTDPDCWQRISEVARLRAKSDYSVETHIAKITAIYRVLLGT